MARVLLGTLPAILLATTACTNPDDGQTSSENTTLGESAEVSSPLAIFLGIEGPTSPEQQAAQQEYTEQLRIQQEAIASCMQNAGFEYVPVDPDQDSIEVDKTTKAWAETNGFGLTTEIFGQSQVGPGLVGFDDGPAAAYEPNDVIFETLSATERTAYNEAMFGTDDNSGLEITELDVFTGGQPSGCSGAGFVQDPLQDFYTEFDDDLGQLYQNVQQDQRFAEAEEATYRCMADKGMPYTGLQDLIEVFGARVNSIDALVTPDEYEAMTEDERQASIEDPPLLSDADNVILAQLQEEEIELALAAIDCGGGPEDEERLSARIAAEFEQVFLEVNADRLAEYKAP